MQKFATVIFITLCHIGLFASPQQTTIKGYITEVGNDQPISYAHVQEVGESNGTITDAIGYFSLTTSKATTQLRCSSMGFESFLIDVNASDLNETPLRIALEESALIVPGMTIERSSMVGGLDNIQSIPGSAHYISPEELTKYQITDINRIVTKIPGVNVVEEEGFGLRPNIGIRGTGTERSSKITLMEDGVLIAPAPYAAPAAYYFPLIARMEGIEIRKGSSQIKYGPFTTGGAINFISSQIHDGFRAQAKTTFGSFNQRDVAVKLSQGNEKLSFLLEGIRMQNDGFKEIPGGADTGFLLEDVVGKLRYTINSGELATHNFELKYGWNREDSKSSYLGLHQSDFDENPFQRYLASEKDQMNAKQQQLVFTYQLQLASNWDFTTKAYHNKFERNWYKLDKATVAGDNQSIANVLASDDYPDHLSLFKGNGEGELFVKANNREYYSKGVQNILGYHLDLQTISHDFELGLRIHQDQMDRFQWIDTYTIDESRMTLTSAGTPGTESNRIETADALATYLQYRLSSKKWTVQAGLRYEDITISRSDYGKADTGRLGTDLSERSNSVQVLIPGFSAAYSFDANTSLFAGVHRGFSPPSSKEGSEPEKSWNYELGTKWEKGKFRTQVTGFYQQYSNLLGSDLAAAGAVANGDLFNAGQVDVKGIEFEISGNLATPSKRNFAIPVSVSYTYNHGEFQESFESDFDPWGTVTAGDEMPYLSNHQLNASVGVELNKFSLSLNTYHSGEMRTTAGTGTPEIGNRIAGRWNADVVGHYYLNNSIEFFAKVKNLTDEVYVVSDRPAGLRPGLPRSFSVGAIWGLRR